MPTLPKGRVAVTVIIDEKLKKKLKTKAKRDDKPLSGTIEQLIVRGLEADKQRAK